MDLARKTVDVGLFTNRLEEMQAFYGDKLGLQFETMLPVGAGTRQYRYLANGSVVKVMHARDALRPRQPGGYDRITIATPKVTAPETLHDPDGNTVELVPPGHNGVTQMEIHLGVSDPEAYERFYRDAVGAERISPGRYKIGETIFSFSKDPAATRAPVSPPFDNPVEVVKAMAALGIRYVTIQVRNCDAAHKALTSAGLPEIVAPANMTTVARICFVRDPDGNFVEISQRPPS